MIKAGAIPHEITDFPNWVLWKYGLARADGKRPKRPFMLNGSSARVNDPATWCSFAEALAAYINGGFDGIGFVLTVVTGFVGIDLDNCFDGEDKLVPWARRIVEELPTYWELSPSGHGLHGFIKGVLPSPYGGGAKRKGVEVYADVRFLTVTGEHLPGTPITIESHQTTLEAMLAREIPRPQPTGAGVRAERISIAPQPVGSSERISDDALLEYLRNRPDGRGEKFTVLFDRGDTSAYDDDDSRADLALANTFVAACDHDGGRFEGNDVAPLIARVDRFMRRSALLIPAERLKKWDKKHSSDGRTYGQMTIQTALGDLTWPSLCDLPDAATSVPTMIPDMVPEPFRARCVDAAERMNVALEAIAVPMILASAAAIARRVTLQPKQHDQEWKIYPTIWGMLIAESAERKSSAINAGCEHIRAAERQAQTNNEQASSAHKAREDELARNIKTLWKNKTGSKEEKGARLTTIAELQKEQSALPKPIKIRYVIRDSTYEKIAEILRDNPRGILSLHDELAGWFASLEKENQTTARTFFLSAWSGDEDGGWDRIGRGSGFVPRVALWLFGGIQPGPLKKHVIAAHEGAAGSDGLLQRFQLMVWPEERPPAGYIDRSPDEAAATRVKAIFDGLLAFDPIALGAKKKFGEELPTFYFSHEAQALFATWYAEHEAHTKSHNVKAIPAFRSHLGKFDKLVCTLALDFHIVLCVANKQAGPVSLDALALAIKWTKFLEYHARKIYDVTSRAPGMLLAQRIKRTDAYGVKDGDSLRDLARKGWSGLGSPEIIIQAVAELEPLGWCRIEEHPAVGKDARGRPTRVIRLHPKLRYTKSEASQAAAEARSKFYFAQTQTKKRTDENDENIPDMEPNDHSEGLTSFSSPHVQENGYFVLEDAVRSQERF